MDIFNRPISTVGGVFNADKGVAAISAGGTSAVGALFQQIQGNYSQDYRDIYELGSNQSYHVVGRPKGRLQIGRIMGIAGAQIDDSLFDSCNTGATITLRFSPSGCVGVNANITYVLSGVVVIDYGFSTSVDEMLVRENMTFAFKGLTKAGA